MACETTTADPELIQTQVASLLAQPLEAGLDATLKTRLVTDVSNALLTGAGTSNTIPGIINQSGVQTHCDVHGTWPGNARSKRSK